MASAYTFGTKRTLVRKDAGTLLFLLESALIQLYESESGAIKCTVFSSDGSQWEQGQCNPVVIASSRDIAIDHVKNDGESEMLVTALATENEKKRELSRLLREAQAQPANDNYLNVSIDELLVMKESIVGLFDEKEERKEITDSKQLEEKEPKAKRKDYEPQVKPSQDILAAIPAAKSENVKALLRAALAFDDNNGVYPDRKSLFDLGEKEHGYKDWEAFKKAYDRYFIEILPDKSDRSDISDTCN